MKTVIRICLIFLLVLLPSFSFSAEQYPYSRKDPILAGALSWYVPGLGQMYSGAFLKGATFFIVEETLLLSTLLTFVELKFDVTGGIDIGLNIKSREHQDRNEQKIGIFLGVAFIVVHFVNVIDAVNTSLKYNRSLEHDFYTDIGYSAENDAYEIEFNRRF